MKLRYGDMLIMDIGNGALKLQIIGRDDVPRVEKEGRGWRDGATALLKGADVAVFQDALTDTSGRFMIGDSGLTVKVGYKGLPASGREVQCLDLSTKLVVLSIKDVSVELTWPERTLLMWAVRGIAWKMFM